MDAPVCHRCPHCAILFEDEDQKQHCTCADCGRGPFCSQRCRFMDYEIGSHGWTCPARLGPSTFAAHAAPSSRVYLPYQTVPGVSAYLDPHDSNRACVELGAETFAMGAEWMAQCALRPPSAMKARLHFPTHVLQQETTGESVVYTVERLHGGVYVLLGEDDYESVHEASDNGRRPAHRFVGGARWSVPRSELDLVAFARDLGQILGDVHFRQQRDAAGFSVVGASTQSDEQRAARLFVQCDLRKMRTLEFDRVGKPDDDTVDRLAYVLGRLAYTPRPRQEQLFKAFATGYKASAAVAGLESYAKAVLKRMLIYTE